MPRTATTSWRRRWPSAVLVPPRCGGCGAALPTTARLAWCPHCQDRWGAVPGWWTPVPGGCHGWAAATYRGPARRAVLTAKRGAPTAAAELLLARLPATGCPPGADVTWVPAHPRRALRGPDSGQALASALAAREQLIVRRLLSRSPLARRQAGLPDDARRADPARLGLRVRARPRGPVVLVDDVRTTGTTLDAAARLLRAAGAPLVLAIVVASVPDPLDDERPLT